MDRLRRYWLRIVLVLLLRRRRRIAAKKWNRPIFEKRRKYGDFHHLLQKMRLNDKESFFDYYRMSFENFDNLLGLVGPLLLKCSLRREPISPTVRLALTLRYLATGDSQTSLSHQFNLSKTTVSNILAETTMALWRSLKDVVFLSPTERNWKEVASTFWEKLNFPNCLGAIDAKRILTQAPANSDCEFVIKKETHKFVLLAACDAHHCFTIVEIGGADKESDNGTFKNSLFGRYLEEEKLFIPPLSHLPEITTKCPYVFVADEAFPLSKFLMRPYPSQRIETYEKVFNYRLSRARRIIENAFGIMSIRFRILNRPIHGNVENIEHLIKATLCLHNWIIKNEDPMRQMYCPPGFADEEIDGQFQPGHWRNEEVQGGAIQDMGRVGSNNYSKEAWKVREDIAEYFMGKGQVPWQLEKL